MENNKYTERQLQIINGEISIESVDGRFLCWFHKKAILNNDADLANKIEQQLKKCKSQAYENSKQRNKSRQDKLRHGKEIKWKQPKSNEYTEHQKRVVNGEIPYEEVHTKELIHIHLKAHNNGDYELSERILDLITALRLQESENQRRYRKQYKLKHNGARRKSKKFNQIINLGVDLPLTYFDKAALVSCEDLSELSEAHLNQTLEMLKVQQNEEAYDIIEALLLYKKDPYSFCVVRDHREAVDMIENLLQLPIRRPNTWFSQEDTSIEDG